MIENLHLQYELECDTFNGGAGFNSRNLIRGIGSSGTSKYWKETWSGAFGGTGLPSIPALHANRILDGVLRKRNTAYEAPTPFRQQELLLLVNDPGF